MLDFIRARDPVSRVSRKRGQDMKALKNSFLSEHSREPFPHEYLERWLELGFPEDKFDDFFYGNLTPGTISLDAGFEDEKGDFSESNSYKLIPDKRIKDPFHALLDQEIFEVIERDIRAVPGEDHKAFFRAYLIEKEPLAVAAAMVGLSESRGSQMVMEYMVEGTYFTRTREYLGITDDPKEIELDLSSSTSTL